MRPIWKGHISFGLVAIPVSLYSAEQKTDLHFRMLDSRNHARIRFERINEETGEEVPWNEIVRAYELDKNDYVLVEDQDFKKAAPVQTKTIDIENFVDQSDIPPIYFEKPYYLVPEQHGIKSYVLLREALKSTGKAGLARIIIHTREHLGLIMPCQNGLILDLIRYQQEIKPIKEMDLPQGKPKEYRIQPKELDLAKDLINQMTEKFNPALYHDQYRDTLLKWIQQKAKKGVKQTPVVEEPKYETEVVDLMSLMRKSLQKVNPKSPKRSYANTKIA